MFNFGLFSNSFSVFLCTMTKRILLFKLFSLEVYFFHGSISRKYADDRIGEDSLPLSPRYHGQLTAKPFAVRCPSDARSCKHGGRPPGVSRKKQAGQNARPAVSTKNRDFMRFFRIPSAPGFPLQCAALPLPRSQRSSSRSTPQNTGALNSTLLLSPEPGNLYQKV